MKGQHGLRAGQGCALARERWWGCSTGRGGLPARRGNAGLDEVQQDPSDFMEIGNEGEHLHRGAAAAAVKGVNLVDLGQQPRPGAARGLGGYELLRAVLRGLENSFDEKELR